MTHPDFTELAALIKIWAKALGFQGIGISGISLQEDQIHFEQWIKQQYHGTMKWLENNQELRFNPTLLHPETVRVISVRMNYLPKAAKFAETLKKPDLAYISRYALGRDYHKVLRSRLKALGQKIDDYCQTFSYRVCVDSAPVLERSFAAQAGLGWTGKHSLLVNPQNGSWFFLGELLINLPLPIDNPIEEKCGKCVACLKICPTQAIIAPYTVDARRCISYLTIEHDGTIPIELRPLMGNRIYGCDDCQLVCPWNRFATLTEEQDFSPRTSLYEHSLITLFQWSEATFLKNTEGSPIRRIGYLKWLRNISVALGNGIYTEEAIQALQAKKALSTMLDEHIDWAIAQLTRSKNNILENRATTKHRRLIRIIETGLPRDA